MAAGVTAEISRTAFEAVRAVSVKLVMASRRHAAPAVLRDDDAVAAAANAMGARTVALTSVPAGLEQYRSPRHLHLNQYWPVNDAVLELPGYDVKACPLSLIVTWSCYQAIVGEVVAPGGG